MNKNKILAIDFGFKNVGLAVSDATWELFFGRGVVKGKKKLVEVFDEIKNIIISDEVGIVVFGVPNSLSDEGFLWQESRMLNIGNKLKNYLIENNIFVEFFFEDESFTTFEATKELFDIHKFGIKSNLSDHEMSAIIILKRFVEKNK